MLRHVGKKIESSIREDDFAARFGGDEFLVILSNVKTLAVAEAVAEKILGSVSETFHLEGQAIRVNSSVGIAVHASMDESGAKLIQRADGALLKAKSKGRDTAEWNRRQVGRESTHSSRIAAALPAALRSNDFELFFQPIADLSSNQFRRAEALIRWNHADLGQLSPREFIPIAEASGLICDVGAWVLNEVARCAPAFLAAGGEGFKLCVNLSALELTGDDGRSREWSRMLERLGTTGQHLIVEVSEDCLMDRVNDVELRIGKLAAAGIELAIDDFGTGASSIPRLGQLPVDYIKIDGSFVSKIEDDNNSVMLCEAIVAMAKKMNVRVVAEGIETEAQLNILKKIGCDYGQGYLFTRPLDKLAFKRFLADTCRVSQ